MIVNYDHTVITVVNYNCKTFIVLATGRKPGQVFNFRIDCFRAKLLSCFQVKLPILTLRTWLKHLLGSFLLNIATPSAQTSLAGNPYWRGRLGTIDLLVLTSLHQLIFIMKILFTLNTKRAILIRRSTVLSLSLQLVFPVTGLQRIPIFKVTLILFFNESSRLKTLTRILWLYLICGCHFEQLSQLFTDIIFLFPNCST